MCKTTLLYSICTRKQNARETQILIFFFFFKKDLVYKVRTPIRKKIHQQRLISKGKQNQFLLFLLKQGTQDDIQNGNILPRARCLKLQGFFLGEML